MTKPTLKELDHRLDFITRELQWWMEFDNMIYKQEGRQPPGDDKSIMCTPMWPTHGMLKNWVETLQVARECLAGKPSSNDTASPTATEAETSRGET